MGPDGSTNQVPTLLFQGCGDPLASGMSGLFYANAPATTQDFEVSRTVHHTNYFEQLETIRFVEAKLLKAE